MRIVIAALTALALAGCAGVKTKATLTDKTAPLQASSGKVCLLAGALPDGIKSIEIARITAVKRSYGGVDNLMLPIANEARRVGADAVINLQADQRFKSPMPWRINAPTGDGYAVKLTADSPPLDCAAAGGQLT